MAQHSTPEPVQHASLEARIRTAVEVDGERAVADRARSLLEGHYEGEEFLRVVGGPHADGILGGAPALYWPELWGARALLHVWDEGAESAVVSGLENQAWRVREMCAKVCAERGVGDPAVLARLTNDDHARVRAAAARALAVVGTESSVAVLEAMFRDPDKENRRAAQQALRTVRAKLIPGE